MHTPSFFRLLVPRGAAALLLGVLLSQPACAQKIVAHKVWTRYHKTASTPLDARYKSYSVEYDLGQPLLYTPKMPPLPGLERKASGGDLTLRITRKGLTTQPGEIERRKNIGGTEEHFFARTSYAGEIGYTLLDARTNTPLVSFRQEPGGEKTRSFEYRWDLETYLSNAYAHELAKKLLDQLHRRIDYTLADHTWQARVGVNQVEGEAPVYQQISQAAAELELLLAAPAPDKARLRALAATWEAQLATADWANKKADINRKVANALLENLCTTYLLLEDYPQLQEKAKLYTTKNFGVLDLIGDNEPALTFEVEKSFSGPTVELREVVKDNVAATYYVVKFAGDLAGPAQ